MESREIICCTLDARKSNIVKKFMSEMVKIYFRQRFRCDS